MTAAVRLLESLAQGMIRKGVIQSISLGLDIEMDRVLSEMTGLYALDVDCDWSNT